MSKKKVSIGKEIYDFEKRLFPYNRYLMGEGVRKTLNDIKSVIPALQIYGVECGTKVFDWTIPMEWVIKEAYLEDDIGNRIIDFNNNNLHVMVYSDSIDQKLNKNELQRYIYIDESNPDAIPYVTSYYKNRVGMCMTKKMWDELSNDKIYHIKIDSEKIHGTLNYADYLIKGQSDEEIAFHSVICHPSLANDELSGPVLATFLAREIGRLKSHYYSYRFIFVPETIGAITYISKNLDELKKRVKAGFILSCEGDNGGVSYLPTIQGNMLSDKVARKVLKTLHPEFKSYTFMDRGSDERQYNAPGVDIPFCVVCRSLAGTFKEYHTSNDNMDYVSPEGFVGSFEIFWNIINLLENNRLYRATNICEPQLSKRGLYADISRVGSKEKYKNYVDFLAYANGKRDLIDISDITGIDYRDLIRISNIMMQNDLVRIEGIT